jgi:hypothetical protein
MKEYESHDAAKLFPMMDGNDMQDLVSDIRKHGLIKPITIFEGKILDGRNRLAACKMAQVEPRFESWIPNGCTPTEWVLSVNLKRRQLTASQRATVAVQALPLLEAEAKERQSKLNGKTVLVEKIPQAEQGKARDKAASIAQVNPRYVSDAKRIKEECPRVFKEVQAGEKTISEAKRQLFGGGKVVAEDVAEERAAEAERDSENLWALKSTWRRASKKDRAAFLKWIKNNKRQ